MTISKYDIEICMEKTVKFNTSFIFLLLYIELLGISVSIIPYVFSTKSPRSPLFSSLNNSNSIKFSL